MFWNFCLKIDYSYLESASINSHALDFLAEKNEFWYLSFFEKCKAIVSSICLGKFLLQITKLGNWHILKCIEVAQKGYESFGRASSTSKFWLEPLLLPVFLGSQYETFLAKLLLKILCWFNPMVTIFFTAHKQGVAWGGEFFWP